jgi:hypothetical protein
MEQQANNVTGGKMKHKPHDRRELGLFRKTLTDQLEMQQVFYV